VLSILHRIGVTGTAGLVGTVIGEIAAVEWHIAVRQMLCLAIGCLSRCRFLLAGGLLLRSCADGGRCRS
jgi:hypothetical protein